MAYKIVGGRPVRVEVTRTVGHHPEVVTTVELEVFTCPECGKGYKTEAGLDRHTEDKH
jgi:hypothetical protein